MQNNKSIGQKLMKGSMIRTAKLFMQIAIAFFMMPFIIHSLGDRMYGFWILVGTFIGYYGLLDLGFSSAVGRYISRALGKNDIREMNHVINTSFGVFAVIGAISLLLTCIAAIFCFYFIEEPSEIELFRKVIIVLGISMAIGFPMRVFVGILTSYLRYDLSTYASMLKLIVANFFIYIFLKNGYGIVALALIAFFASLLEYISVLFFAIKTFPHLKISFSYFKKDRAMQLFRYSGKSFVIQLGNILRFRIDSFVIAIYLNLSLITYYAVGARLIEYFVQFIMSSVGIMSPVFSQYESRNDYDSIRKKFLDVTKISILLSVFVGASIIYYGKVFIHRWMGPDFQDSYYVALILCVSYMMALMQNPTIGLLYGISKHHYYAIINTCEGLLNIVLSLILVKPYGIYGVAFGTAISMIIFKVFVQPVIMCHIIKLSLYKYYTETIISNVMKILIPLLLYFFIIKDYLRADYISIATFVSVQILLFIPLVFFLILGRKERQLIMNAVNVSR